MVWKRFGLLRNAADMDRLGGPELPVVQRNAAELKVSKEVVATILEDFLELPLCEAPAPDPEEGSP